MSKPPGEEKVAGAPSTPASDPAAAEIRAEIDDHLATSAEQLQSQGLAPHQARQLSQEKFGDPTAITRRCYWIKQGDTLMFRTAVILLLAALCLALGFTTVSSVRAQRQMAQQMAALAEQLQAIAERERAATPTAAVEPKALEITGHAYIGSPDKPAAHYDIKICKAASGEVIRRIATGSDGSFASGPLPADDYYLATSEASKSPSVDIQSAPILLYPSSEQTPVQFDVAFPFGRLAIETSRSLPRFDPDSKTPEGRIIIKVLMPRLRSVGWSSTEPAPPAWPVFASRVSRPNANESASYPQLWFYEVLSNEKLERRLAGTIFQGDEGRIPAGECLIQAEIILGGALPQAAPQSPTNETKSKFRVDGPPQNPFHRLVATFNQFGPYALRPTEGWKSEDYAWAKRYLDHVMNVQRPKMDDSHFLTVERQFNIKHEFSRVQGDGAVSTPISAGAMTRIRIEIPDDLESRYNDAFDASDPEKAKAAWKDGSPLTRRPSIIVLGSEPLTNDEPQGNF